MVICIRSFGACVRATLPREGAIVVLLEKEKSIGGNSAKATSGINGINTTAQVGNSWAIAKYGVYHYS